MGAAFRLPFGWFATDDGRRTMVFDDDGRIQISFKLRRTNRTSLPEIARSLVQPYLQRQPGLPLTAFTFEDDIAGAGVQGAEIDGESLDQFFLVRPAPRAGYVLVARVTARGDDTRLAVKLTGDILAGLEPQCEGVTRELVARN